MKSKIKPIRDLYFRFLQTTEIKMNAQQLAVLLAENGLIVLVPHKNLPLIQHYRDAEGLSRLTYEDLKKMVEDTYG